MQGFITELGGSKNGYFRRKVYITRDDSFEDSLIKFIDEYRNTDVYYCLYNYESTDIENCPMIASPYLDFDTEIETEEDYQRVRREVHMAMQYFNRYFFIPFEMLQIYFSGNKGFHLVVPYEVGISADQQDRIVPDRATQKTTTEKTTPPEESRRPWHDCHDDEDSFGSVDCDPVDCDPNARIRPARPDRAGFRGPSWR